MLTPILVIQNIKNINSDQFGHKWLIRPKLVWPNLVLANPGQSWHGQNWYWAKIVWANMVWPKLAMARAPKGGATMDGPGLGFRSEGVGLTVFRTLKQ